MILRIIFIIGLSLTTTVNAALITVDTAIGEEGCDLIDAINSANNNANEGGCSAINYGDDTILLTRDQILSEGYLGGYTGLPRISSTMTIDGSQLAEDNELFKIRRSDDSTTSSFRIFEVSHIGKLTLHGLEISNGSFENLDTPGFIPGGGILVQGGELILTDVVMIDNVAELGGALYVAGDDSRVRIERSSIYNNRALNDGGGVSLGPQGDVRIYDSTIANNTSDGFGAGISMSIFSSENQLFIYNTTISGNVASLGGGIYLATISETISDPSNTVTIRNSLISGNSHFSSLGGQDIFIGDFVFTPNYPTMTFENNIVGQSEYTSEQSVRNLVVGLANNFIATSDGNKPTSINNIIGSLRVDVKGLAYLPLVYNSPAIDTGVPYKLIVGGPPLFIPFYQTGCTGILVGIGAPEPYRVDQLGVERPIGSECDIGAVEYEPEPEQCFVIPTANDKTVVFCL